MVVQGKYNEAEPLYRRLLALKMQALGSHHPDVARSLNNLALVLQEQVGVLSVRDDTTPQIIVETASHCLLSLLMRTYNALRETYSL